MMYSPYAYGVYLLDKGAPVTGVAYGDYLVVDPSDENPYVLTRILSFEDAEKILAILAAEGCRVFGDQRPHLEVVR